MYAGAPRMVDDSDEWGDDEEHQDKDDATGDEVCMQGANELVCRGVPKMRGSVNCRQYSLALPHPIL